MTRGRRAYEQDVKGCPNYYDGTPRRTWAQLRDFERWSWEKSPYPLPCPPENPGRN
jgi:hypothetical protein